MRVDHYSVLRAGSSLRQSEYLSGLAVRKVRTPQGTVLPNGKTAPRQSVRRRCRWHVQQRAVPFRRQNLILARSE